jgi:3-isopropylmalate/(R)-2-methylmalate dehydratase small subunit
VRAVTVVSGPVAALDRASVDTDQIIPKQFLKRIERTGFGEFLFFDWMKDPAFPLRRPDFASAPILAAGRNFGCGSSREHAPIALGSAKCRIVLAESFARIFFRNCVATGELYPCEITGRLCDVLKTGDVVTVDLDSATVTVKNTGKVYKFKPLGDVRPVVDAGGIFNYARKSGMIPAQG